MKRLLCVLCCAFVLCALTWGCGRRAGQVISVVGSTSIQPFAEMEAQEFHRRHPDLTVEVQGGGSTAGLQAVVEGIAEIGTCSRGLKAEETGFVPIAIARDGLAIVVHPENPVNDLSTEQLRRLFAGEVTNWKEVGGIDHPVWLITREEGSGTREAFVKLVMGKERISRAALTQESNGAVKELVRNDRHAIGYMSLGLVDQSLKVLHVDGTAATADTVRRGIYPLVRPFLFVTRGPVSPGAQAFISFVLSPDGQALLEREGLVGVAEAP